MKEKSPDKIKKSKWTGLGVSTRSLGLGNQSARSTSSVSALGGSKVFVFGKKKNKIKKNNE
jgi:hypothetical protein